MFYMAMHGYPLARTQGELTYKQKLFLSYAAEHFAQNKQQGKKEQEDLKGIVDQKRGG